jgi:DNA primase
MSKTHYVDFKAIKAAVTMEQALQRYGLLDRMQKNGDSLSGCCPIHGGNNPTQFRVSLSKNCWNCFGSCKQGGNVLDFVAKKEDISVHVAALKLCEWFNLPMGEKPQKEERAPSTRGETQAAPTPAAALDAETNPALEDNTPNQPLKFQLEHLDTNHAYLKERGLTSETIAHFGLGYCAKGMMAGRIAIPIRNVEGKIVAYAGRWPGDPPEGAPKYKLPPGFRKSLELFNLDQACREQTDKLVIVEGFFGAMKLWQCGVKQVIALMGSTLSNAQAELVRKHSGSLCKVLVMLDEDDAGRAGRAHIIQRLAPSVFVKAHVFAEPGRQPENLTTEEIAALLT